MRMKGIMIQGTASHVGKSIITTAICRMLIKRGFKVSPFKSQNMTSNTAHIAGSKEIGISQMKQAEAARLTPKPWMNPVLLKPLQNMQLEVFLLGKSQGIISGGDFKDLYYEKALVIIKEALSQIEVVYDYVIIEGAGSPVEMNLRERDLSNMAIAELADIPVLLVADIEKGGIFASIVGTLMLLTEAERARVKGLVINKFIGNQLAFADGVTWLEKYTGLPVIGVIPYLEHNLNEEDSLKQTIDLIYTRSERQEDYEKLATHLETYLNVEKLLSIMEGMDYDK